MADVDVEETFVEVNAAVTVALEPVVAFHDDVGVAERTIQSRTGFARFGG
jgi:hypothetical protein